MALRRNTTAGRGALAAVTLGSGMALLDGTVVNLAVPTIGRELDASLAQVQWVVNGYLLSMAALILVSGALGDRVGRRRVYSVGIALFAIASLACALAADPAQLIAARVAQGVGGTLLTPGALAVIQASFAPEDRASAIGTWAGTSGIATALGPFVGGVLLDHGGWRWIFAINLPIAAAVLFLVWRFVPESRNPEASGGLDAVGAALTVGGLGLLTWGLIGAGEADPPVTLLRTVGGLVLLGGFTAYERRATRPLVPMGLFGSRHPVAGLGRLQPNGVRAREFAGDGRPVHAVIPGLRARAADWAPSADDGRAAGVCGRCGVDEWRRGWHQVLDRGVPRHGALRARASTMRSRGPARCSRWPPCRRSSASPAMRMPIPPPSPPATVLRCSPARCSSPVAASSVGSAWPARGLINRKAVMPEGWRRLEDLDA